MYGLSKYIYDEFSKVETDFRDTRLRIFLWAVSPRLILDLIAIIASLAFIYYFKISSEQLAILAVLFLRLSPYVSSIFMNYAKVIAYHESTKTLRQQSYLKNQNKHPISNPSESKKFSRNTLLYGPSGSGKSTKMLKHFSIYRTAILDFKVFEMAIKEASIFLQRTPELDLTFGEFASILKINRWYIKRLKLDSLGSQAHIANLSGGELQRVWLAVTFSKKSEYLFFDEPTNNLDGEMIEEFLSILDNDNRKKIIVSHDEKVIEYCQKQNYQITRMNNE